ncbi:MAG: hypothetical protein D3915_01945 [Candidatus Electrothrix sp. AU1_5]|nr:hypothetical protein [Candidatus Electrothrix gigas]
MSAAFFYVKSTLKRSDVTLNLLIEMCIAAIETANKRAVFLSGNILLREHHAQSQSDLRRGLQIPDEKTRRPL